MKELKMCNGDIMCVEKIELTGRLGDGYDIWYLNEETGEIHHNLSFEKDLPEVEELINVMKKLKYKYGETDIFITLSKNV